MPHPVSLCKESLNSLQTHKPYFVDDNAMLAALYLYLTKEQNFTVPIDLSIVDPLFFHLLDVPFPLQALLQPLSKAGEIGEAGEVRQGAKDFERTLPVAVAKLWSFVSSVLARLNGLHLPSLGSGKRGNPMSTDLLLLPIYVSGAWAVAVMYNCAFVEVEVEVEVEGSEGTASRSTCRAIYYSPMDCCSTDCASSADPTLLSSLVHAVLVQVVKMAGTERAYNSKQRGRDARHSGLSVSEQREAFEQFSRQHAHNATVTLKTVRSSFSSRCFKSDSGLHVLMMVKEVIALRSVVKGKEDSSSSSSDNTILALLSTFTSKVNNEAVAELRQELVDLFVSQWKADSNKRQMYLESFYNVQSKDAKPKAVKVVSKGTRKTSVRGGGREKGRGRGRGQ